MLKVAQELFSQGGTRSGIASTHRIPPLKTMVPFILPAEISLTQPTHCGRGMIVPVTGAANTSIVVKHNLGRFAQVAWALINQGAFSPRLMFDPAGTSTQQKQSIIADGAMNQCLILFF